MSWPRYWLSIGSIGSDAQQFVEALQEQGMAFFGNLFGLTYGDQDTAQVVEQNKMIGNDVGHEISPQEQNGRGSIKLLRPL